MHETTRSKADWRRELSGRRREYALSPLRRGEAGRLADLAQALLPDPGDIIATYVPMRTEPDIAAVHSMALARGVRILVPAVHLDTDDHPQWCTGTTEVGGAAVGSARAIFIPALAADLSGTRLGRGGGWYDRALVHAAPDAVRIAVVFPWEVLPAGTLPREPHDQPIHRILTTDGLIRLSPRCFR